MVYLFYSIIVFLLGLYFVGQNKVRKSYYYVLFISIISFWGLSFIYAPDTIGYINLFYQEINPLNQGLQIDDRRFEAGYILLAQFFKTISPYYCLFQFIVFSIEMLLIIKGLKWFFNDKMMMMILPLLFFLYPSNLAAFRQGISLSIFIYSLHYIFSERKWLWFFLLIFIASLFHQSSLLLFVFFVVRFAKTVLSREWFVIIVLLLCDLLYFNGVNFFNDSEMFAAFLSNYSFERGDNYIMVMENYEAESFGYAKVFEINLTVLLFTFCCRSEKNCELLRFSLLMYLICGLVIGGFIGHRLIYYWHILYYVCLVAGISSLFRNKKSISYSLVAIYMLWFFIYKCGFIQYDYKFLFGT